LKSCRNHVAKAIDDFRPPTAMIENILDVRKKKKVGQVDPPSAGRGVVKPHHKKRLEPRKRRLELNRPHRDHARDGVQGASRE
jgi:hypothetical protein